MYSFRYPDARRVGIEFKEPSLTKQSDAQAADINNIMRKYRINGVVDHVSPIMPQFADVSQVGDYQAALNAVMHADELFYSLPAKLRSEFSNDPSLLVHFAQQYHANPDDPVLRRRALELGLINEVQTNIDIPKPDSSAS